MQNNPYDDLLKSLAKLLEQMSGLEQNMRFMQDQSQEAPRIIGCAIISSSIKSPDNPHDPFNRHIELPYEMVDAGETAYMTIQLPTSIATDPHVEINAEEVVITAGGTVAPVNVGLILPLYPK